MKKITISISLLFTLFYTLCGQEIIVNAKLDTSRIYLGDQIKYLVTIEKPGDLWINIPVFKDTLCKNIEILAGPVTDSSAIQDGRVRIIQKYLITSFDSGKYQLPPVFVELKNENGVKRFYSDFALLEVIRTKIAPVDTASKIFDIIKPYGAPVTIGEVMPWVLLVILAIALIWLIFKYIKKLRKPKEKEEVVINPDPAHIIAFRELEKLRQEELWQKGEFKIFYTRLTEILRQYLENRYSVFSLELTTYETLEALVKSGFKKNESYNQLKTILTGADMVKFAKYIPESEENELHFQNSWDFVLATKAEEITGSTGDGKEKIREEIK